MHVRWLELTGFRSYASLDFAPDPGLNVLVGPNGHGKTSLLEAVDILLSGRSFRTVRLAECVAWPSSEARVNGAVVRDAQEREVRLTLRPRAGGVELRGTTPCPWARAVTFSATDLALVTGMPPYRRAYLDGAATKLVPAHAEACRRYRLVLQQRAHLLARLQGRGDAERLLAPWDEQVAGLGSEIVHRRLDTLAILGPEVREIVHALSPREARVELEYQPAVAPGPERAATRDLLRAALAAGRPRELARGLTLVGPHRDDLSIRFAGAGAEARTGASRGEQRLLALGLRLAEASLLRRRLGVAPVFVLDDALSELDGPARRRVIAWLAPQGQVLCSTTEAALPEAPGVVWEVRGGEVAALAGLGASRG